MKLILSVLLLAALATASRVTFDGASGARSLTTPRGWTVGERTTRDAPMRLSFAVKLRNTDESVRTLDAVSDPTSPRYGQHLSLAAVDAMTAPADADVERVVAWLRDEGVEELDVAGGFVRAHVNAELAERLVACEFRAFRHARSGAEFARCASPYSLPAHVAALVDFVGGTRHLPNMEHRLDVQMNRARAKTAAAAAASASASNVEVKKKQAPIAVTPKSLRSRYGLGSPGGRAANNSVCVLGFLGQYFSTLDLGEFYTLFYPELSGTKVNVIGKQPGLPGVEAELDIQYVTAMAAKINATFWSNPAKVANNEPFLDWAQQAAMTPDLPLVISVSYGETEYGNELAYVQRMDAEFVKLGNRGVSLVFASGDSGVGCDPTNHFGPDFPATAPHVTSVGAAGGDSVATFSSGGFSNFFPRQSWQAASVAAYLSQTGLPPAHYYNATGRGFPDVAAQGENFLVVVDLLPEPVDGTSCAAPTFAGIFALLNDLRLNAGKAPLGFLNFVLYANQAAMIDITEGANPGQNFCGVGGFPAKQGWDPATGIGEPHYEKWAAIVKQLP